MKVFSVMSVSSEDKIFGESLYRGLNAEIKRAYRTVERVEFSRTGNHVQVLRPDHGLKKMDLLMLEAGV